MNANQIYALESGSIDISLATLYGWGYNHVPEIDWDEAADEELKNERVTVRIVKHHNYDWRRFWRLASVWLDDKPVMIIQNAGREGDDHHARFVTDSEAYREMVEYIISLFPKPQMKYVETIDANENIPGLTRFYSQCLEGPFRKD